jgi:hypothetical protein
VGASPVASSGHGLKTGASVEGRQGGRCAVRRKGESVIGVRCNEGEREVVREFFELFKTPWAFYEPGAFFDVVLDSAQEATGEIDAPVLIIFTTAASPDTVRRGCILEADGQALPLYGAAVALTGDGSPRGRVAGTKETLVMEKASAGQTVLRCGYSLFDEVELLLTRGQPIEHASVATLDVHIALLRAWIVEAGAEVIEIPPVPPSYSFLACLTHDVDFLGIRRHRADTTLLGFLARATAGSVLDVVRRRRTLMQLLRNLAAVLSLPLVHLRLKPDFWLPFERYAEVEGDLRSTFFLVPFANRAGRGLDGPSDPRRAVRYGVAEARAWGQWLRARGSEVALHGIDAWSDVESAREERDAVLAVTGERDLGVRMHWLYLDPDSVAKLDQARFTYDSTFGYNDVVGWRAGTTQVFRPLGAERMLELPLHIQDTALLYPRRMHCRPSEATRICRALIDETRKLGGVLTVSWHERSLVPERQWDVVYRELLDDLRRAGASIRPARDVVAWFELRRAVDLEAADIDRVALSSLAARESCEAPEPTLLIRVHGLDGTTEVAAHSDDVDALLSSGRSTREPIGAVATSDAHRAGGSPP